MFDSSAILLYLAEKTGKFLPAKTDKARGELCRGCSLSPQELAPILVNRCISAFMRRRRFLTPPIAMPLKHNAMPVFSMRGLAQTWQRLIEYATNVKSGQVRFVSEPDRGD